jgi:3D (Asp-Asp-Asp) domain-containing protein
MVKIESSGFAATSFRTSDARKTFGFSLAAVDPESIFPLGAIVVVVAMISQIITFSPSRSVDPETSSTTVR